MLLHVWVGLIHLLSPEQFPLGQCGRLVLAISPTEPVKCPAQTEIFHDLIGLRFFEGGWQIWLMSDIKLNHIKIHEFFSRFYEWILFVIGFGGLVSKGHLPLWQAWATQTARMQGNEKNLSNSSKLDVPWKFQQFLVEARKQQSQLLFWRWRTHIVAIEDGPWFLDSMMSRIFLKSKSQTWLPERTKRMTMAVPFFGRGSQFWGDRASQIEPHLTIDDLWRYRAQSCTDCRYELRYDLSPLMLKAATQHSNLFWSKGLAREHCGSGPSEVMITGGMKCIREARSRWGCPASRFLPIIYNMTIFNSFISLKLHLAANRLDSLKVPLVLFQPCRSFLQAGLAGPRLFQHTLAGLEK